MCIYIYIYISYRFSFEFHYVYIYIYYIQNVNHLFRQQVSCSAQDAHEAGRPISSAPANVAAVMSCERTSHIPQQGRHHWGVWPGTFTQQINTTHRKSIIHHKFLCMPQASGTFRRQSAPTSYPQGTTNPYTYCNICT